jgi:hypothetical protein
MPVKARRVRENASCHAKLGRTDLRPCNVKRKPDSRWLLKVACRRGRVFEESRPLAAREMKVSSLPDIASMQHVERVAGAQEVVFGSPSSQCSIVGNGSAGNQAPSEVEGALVGPMRQV